MTEVDAGSCFPTLPQKTCPVPRHGLQTVPGHPLQFWFCYWLCNPAVHHGGPLDCEVDFAQQGGTEEDHESLLQGYDLDVFAGEGFADAPLSSLQIELSLAIDFEQPSSLRVLPARRVELIAARAGLPASGGGLPGGRPVGGDVVMLLAKCIQPWL